MNVKTLFDCIGVMAGYINSKDGMQRQKAMRMLIEGDTELSGNLIEHNMPIRAKLRAVLQESKDTYRNKRHYSMMAENMVILSCLSIHKPYLDKLIDENIVSYYCTGVANKCCVILWKHLRELID